MRVLKNYLKVLTVVTVFSLSFLGISYSSSTEKLAGEEVTIHSLSINQAAACNEDPYYSYGRGNCNSFGRCSFLNGSYGNCTP